MPEQYPPASVPLVPAPLVPAQYAHKIYYEDQSSWGPDDFYALWRYLNRLFLKQPNRDREYLKQLLMNARSPEAEREPLTAVNHQAIKDAEISAMQLPAMSADTRYLLKHLMVLKKSRDPERFEQVLAEYPNLADLSLVPDSGRELLLSREPLFVYTYFTEVGIYL